MRDRKRAKDDTQPKTLSGLSPKNSFLEPTRTWNQADVEGESPSEEQAPFRDSNADRAYPFSYSFSKIPIHSTHKVGPQTKPTVNEPGDVYEQEADQVAEQVIDMAHPASLVSEGEESVEKPLMRKQGAGSSTNLATDMEGVPSVVHSVLNSGGGQPLDPTTRAFMEPRFGYNFGKVRVHTDEQAAESAQSVDALAYTVGENVVFGAGQYNPGTNAGQRLIAHELTHVVQQQSTPAVLQGKLRIGSPSDSAELAADAVAHAVTVSNGQPYRSPALQIRELLSSSSLSYPTIQRAVKTWGGEYDTDRYEFTTKPGWDGVEIKLKFKPNEHVDAELIGMTQTARSLLKGSPVPTSMFGAAADKPLSSRTIPVGEPGAGTRVDRISTHGNPLYAAGMPSAGDTLSSTPTVADWGYHGWHYTDKAGTHEKEALLIDEPQIPSYYMEPKQVFETTALAVKGVQEGTFYGSVQWGWEKDAAGKVTKLPLTLVSNDAPSAVFAKATELWNKGKTAYGVDTIDLPIVTGKYANTQGMWLVSDPSHSRTTIIGKLGKNIRLEVIDKGLNEPFNQTAAGNKWWKVTIVEGPHIGKVGWVIQTNLSDAPI